MADFGFLLLSLQSHRICDGSRKLTPSGPTHTAGSNYAKKAEICFNSHTVVHIVLSRFRHCIHKLLLLFLPGASVGLI